MYATIESPSHALTVLDGVRRTLAETVDLDQLKTYRDEAEAIRQLLKTAAVGLEMQNKAAEVKLQTERRIGGILESLRLHGGDRKSDHRGKGMKLEEFGISRTQSSHWQREASLPEEEFREYMRQTRQEGKELTSAGLRRAARLYAQSAPPPPARDGCLDDLTQRLRQLARRQAQFACIYVDPPWPNGRKARTNTFRLLRELTELPVDMVAARQAHLHLWVTPELLEEGIKLLRAWGFGYRASLVRTKFPKEFGSFWHQAHDVLLLGVRGRLEFRDSSLPSWIDGDLSLEIHALIERVSPPPYLDLFGSEPVTGWTAGEA